MASWAEQAVFAGLVVGQEFELVSQRECQISVVTVVDAPYPAILCAAARTSSNIE